MKFILIAFLIRDFAGVAPWATSAVAEYNSNEACAAAAQRLQRLADRRNVALEWACTPKGAEQPANAN